MCHGAGQRGIVVLEGEAVLWMVYLASDEAYLRSIFVLPLVWGTQPVFPSASGQGDKVGASWRTSATGVLARVFSIWATDFRRWEGWET